MKPTGTIIDIVRSDQSEKRGRQMNGIIYLVGLVVVVIAVLSFFGLG